MEVGLSGSSGSGWLHFVEQLLISVYLGQDNNKINKREQKK